MLRSLAHNIASGTDQLDIKQGADALYALATLNYHDEVRIFTTMCFVGSNTSKVPNSVAFTPTKNTYKNLLIFV